MMFTAVPGPRFWYVIVYVICCPIVSVLVLTFFVMLIFDFNVIILNPQHIVQF